MAASRVLRVAGVLVAALLPGACAGLIGLDKYVDCDASPQCVADAPTPPVDATPDATLDAEPPPPDAADAADADIIPDGSVRTDWARFKMPHYEGGLLSPTVLTEGGVPADLVHGGNPGSFTAFDGGVLEQASRLSWLTASDALCKSRFADAVEVCTSRGNFCDFEQLCLCSSDLQPLKNGRHAGL